MQLIFILLASLTINAIVTDLIIEDHFQKNTNSKMLQEVEKRLIDFLKIYEAQDETGPIELIRHGKENDGGYVVPLKAIKEADVLLGYGIDTDNSFEDQFSLMFNKPSYGFDCGITQIDSKSNLFTLVPECIGSDKFLYDKTKSSGNISSFSTQLDKLKLKGKKIFIKMDIEGAEYEAFENIFDHHADITGIVLEIHFGDITSTTRALKLLSKLSQEFLLVHAHGNNCWSEFITASNVIGKIPKIIELTYINKSMVKGYHLSKNQAHPKSIDQPNSPNAPEVAFEIID